MDVTSVACALPSGGSLPTCLLLLGRPGCWQAWGGREIAGSAPLLALGAALLPWCLDATGGLTQHSCDTPLLPTSLPQGGQGTGSARLSRPFRQLWHGGTCGREPGFRLELELPVQLPGQEATQKALTGLPAPSWTCWGWVRGGGEGRKAQDSS